MFLRPHFDPLTEYCHKIPTFFLESLVLKSDYTLTLNPNVTYKCKHNPLLNVEGFVGN